MVMTSSATTSLLIEDKDKEEETKPVVGWSFCILFVRQILNAAIKAIKIVAIRILYGGKFFKRDHI